MQIKRKIVGIVLVRNEDLYIEQVLKNILCFCDKIIVADHLSSDRTAERIASLMETTERIDYRRIHHPGKSHDFISKYANRPTWIFATDGDELYDPSGLSRLRGEILSGVYDDWWMILGNVLHCIELNREEQYARGYLTPPCRSMTKLYNFSKIYRWEGPCPERLHGGKVLFKSGYSTHSRLFFYETMTWEESFFRCLHICFLPRSSREPYQEGKMVVRKNIMDKRSESIHRKIVNSLKKIIEKEEFSQYKREKYMRGPIVRKRIQPFFES